MDDDQPIPLAQAATLFPQAGLTISTLRAEATRGIFRLGRRDYTTAAAMKKMVQRCREEDPRRVSTSIQHEANGSSATGRALSAQAALNQTVVALKQGLPRISAKSTRPGADHHH